MMMTSSETTNQSLSKGWSILTQIIYPPFMGFGLGWLIEKKFPCGGLWMLGLLLLFFVAGLYGVVKSYLFELAEDASRAASLSAKKTPEPEILDAKEKTKNDAS
jgi:F0F1-type ATP synthase assembly protein I